MISYADLEKAYRSERTASTLQKLQATFYLDARQLAANPEVGEFLGNIQEYLEKIYYLRANKIIHFAGMASADSKPPENILPEELGLYKAIVEAVALNRAQTLDKKLEVVKEEKKSTVKVRIKQALPAIVGSDSREYGPFREDDVVELPEDNAKILMARNAAEKAETE